MTQHSVPSRRACVRRAVSSPSSPDEAAGQDSVGSILATLGSGMTGESRPCRAGRAMGSPRETAGLSLIARPDSACPVTGCSTPYLGPFRFESGLAETALREHTGSIPEFCREREVCHCPDTFFRAPLHPKAQSAFTIPNGFNRSTRRSKRSDARWWTNIGCATQRSIRSNQGQEQPATRNQREEKDRRA